MKAMNNDTVSEIAELLRPSLTHLGLDLIDVQWSGKGRGAFLRLVIDREGGVTLDDCERASNTASAVLDAYPHDYVLMTPASPVRELMESRPDWKLIYSDPNALLFARGGSLAARLDGVPIRGRLQPQFFP